MQEPSMENLVTYIYRQMYAGKLITLDECAAYFGYDAIYFTKCFKKMFGTSFLHYTLALKMEFAINHLIEGMPVYQISNVLGYSSPSSFSRSFKKQMGVSPSQYKDQLDAVAACLAEDILNQHTQVHTSSLRKQMTDHQLNLTFISLNEEEPPPLILVGLFNERVSLKPPVMELVLVKTDHYVIKNIPEGEYYVLVMAYSTIVPSANLFAHSNCIKGCSEKLFFKERLSQQKVTISLSPTCRLPMSLHFPEWDSE